LPLGLVYREIAENEVTDNKYQDAIQLNLQTGKTQTQLLQTKRKNEKNSFIVPI